MNLIDFMNLMNQWLEQAIPMFRIVWVIAIGIGLILFITAMFLKRNANRKKAVWMIGGFGFILCISSLTQLIVSLL